MATKTTTFCDYCGTEFESRRGGAKGRFCRGNKGKCREAWWRGARRNGARVATFQNKNRSLVTDKEREKIPGFKGAVAEILAWAQAEIIALAAEKFGEPGTV